MLVTHRGDSRLVHPPLLITSPDVSGCSGAISMSKAELPIFPHTCHFCSLSPLS